MSQKGIFLTRLLLGFREKTAIDRPDDDEGVEEVALDAGRGEGGVARLEEHDAHDVVADVTLSLELGGERTSLLSSQLLSHRHQSG